MKRSRSVTDIESSPNGEVAVLEELEDVMFQVCSPEDGVLFWHTQLVHVTLNLYMSVTMKHLLLKLTKKTRVCLRDAFYRLAESSEAQCTTANGGTVTCSTEQSFQQSESIESRYIVLSDQLQNVYHVMPFDCMVQFVCLESGCVAKPSGSHCIISAPRHQTVQNGRRTQ